MIAEKDDVFNAIHRAYIFIYKSHLKNGGREDKYPQVDPELLLDSVIILLDEKGKKLSPKQAKEIAEVAFHVMLDSKNIFWTAVIDLHFHSQSVSDELLLEKFNRIAEMISSIHVDLSP